MITCSEEIGVSYVMGFDLHSKFLKGCGRLRGGDVEFGALSLDGRGVTLPYRSFSWVQYRQTDIECVRLR